MITKAKKGGLHNHRQVVSFLRDKEMTRSCSRRSARATPNDRWLHPHPQARPAPGDNAPMARIELV
jgi:large subunit ribosomal protein L17